MNFVARNSVTNRWWDGVGFDRAPANPAAAKTLSAGELAVLRATYLNVEAFPVALPVPQAEVDRCARFLLKA